MKSIIQSKKCCYVCRTTSCLHDHHIYFDARRKWAEKYGLKVYLCIEHHTGNFSPHQNRELDLKLKRIAQREFEKTHSREEFREIFSKSYL